MPIACERCFDYVKSQTSFSYKLNMMAKCKYLFLVLLISILILYNYVFLKKIIHGRGNEYKDVPIKEARFDDEFGPLWITMQPSPTNRLGNSMYQYAALRAIAHRNGHRRAFIQKGTFGYLIDVFQAKLPVLDHIPWKKWNKFLDVQSDSPKSLIRSYHLPETNITLRGEFQSYRFFQDIQYKIRQEFNFHPKIKMIAENYIRNHHPVKWKNQSIVNVGIHIRRTDHINARYRKLGFFTPKDGYFRKAMTYFLERFPRILFIIATDDRKWCEKHFLTDDYDIVISNNTGAVDFAVLTLCDHMIMTIGTFGWWAGWLNRGTTIYMKDFPLKNTWAAKANRPGYYIPPNDTCNHWVGIPGLT